MKNNETMLITEIGQAQPGIPNLDRQLKHQMMKDLQPETLARIKKGFDLYRGGVKLNQFVAIMVDVLFESTAWRKFKREVLTFIELFLLIDLKNLQKIKFEDFTNYLIDRDTGEAVDNECQFFPCQRLNHLDLQAERVFELAGSPSIALLDSNKKSMDILQKKTYKSTQNVSIGGIIINYAIYIPGYQAYCISTNDKNLNFYQSTENSLVRRFSIPDSIFFLRIYGEKGVDYRLFAGSTNGHLYQFNLDRILSIMEKKNKEKQKQQEDKYRQFSQPEQYRYFQCNKTTAAQPDLTCLDILQSVELLVTGSNDSKVRLYEMRESGLHKTKELDGHYKGVKGISVSIHHKLIVSCSFDFDVLVWNAYLEHPVARLEGHQAPLMNVCCPKNHSIIVSLDAKAIMKIWNADNYQLIQNLVIFQNFPTNSSINFVYKNQSDLAIIYTKRLRFYEYVVNYNPKLTDDQDLTAIRYSPKNLQVYIGSKRNVKVWSIRSGVQVRLYRDVVKGQISVIQLDGRQRRLFIGTIQGQLISLDVLSGLPISRYSKHQQEISLILYNNLHQLLISSGWDRRLKIHNDTQHLDRIQGRDNVMRIINNVGEKEVSGGAFSVSQLLVATHCKTRACRIWDFEKGFLQAQIIVSGQIILVAFIDPLPLLTVIDAKGTISLISTRYHTAGPYKLLTQWKNMYSIQKASQITCISYNYTGGKSKDSPISCQLILGDEYGYVRVVDISMFIAEKEIKPVTPEMLGNKNPYRIEDYNFLGTSQNSTNIHDFSYSQTNSIVPPPTIKQKLQIKAHNDRVTYVAQVKESTEVTLLSAGSDHLVKIWSQKGQQRGVMRQGVKQNSGWMWEMSHGWQNRETIEYQKISKNLDHDFDDHLLKKRMEVIPFTEQAKFEEVNNDQIFKDLKEVEGYLQKNANKTGRIYR